MSPADNFKIDLYKRGKMKKTALLALISLACATIQKPDVMFKGLDRFAEDSVVQVISECTTKLPNGSTRVEQGSGNAFLVQRGVLVSSSHLFTNIRGENCQVLIRVGKKNIKARVIILNTATDVAILEADIHGRALKLREVTDKDQVLYVFGFWPYSMGNDIYGIL